MLIIAFLSYITLTWVIESEACANALLKINAAEDAKAAATAGAVRSESDADGEGGLSSRRRRSPMDKVALRTGVASSAARRTRRARAWPTVADRACSSRLARLRTRPRERSCSPSHSAPKWVSSCSLVACCRHACLLSCDETSA